MAPVFGKAAKYLCGRGSLVDKATADRLAPRARVMKAMAHPTRLYIVEELARGERCVHELTDMVGADMSTVSKLRATR